MNRPYCVRTPASIPIHKILPVQSEWVVWESRASQLENVRDYFQCLIAVVPILYVGWLDEWYLLLLVLPALAGLASWFRIWRKSYAVTTRRLLVRRGRAVVKEMNLLDVVSIKLRTPAVQQRCGRGTLRIYSTDSSRPVLSFIAVPEPETVERKIHEHVERMVLAQAVEMPETSEGEDSSVSS